MILDRLRITFAFSRCAKTTPLLTRFVTAPFDICYESNIQPYSQIVTIVICNLWYWHLWHNWIVNKLLIKWDAVLLMF
jgi:hypothetical protein